jgi:hypothetical protein
MIAELAAPRLTGLEGIMERRKIRDEGDARECIAAVTASGLSPAEWARSAGVDGRSLRAWTLNLQRGSATKPGRTRRCKSVSLVELVPARVSQSAARYTVRIGAHCVEVDEHFEESTLRHLLTALSSC